MTNQRRNAEMVSLLSADFLRNNNPAVMMGLLDGMYKGLPGLVGYWPGSGIGAGSTVSNAITDQSGNGLHLSLNGNARLGYADATKLFSHMSFDGTNGYFSHADATIFDITGAVTIVSAAQLAGLTIGGWFYATDATPTTTAALIGKANTASNTSYMLQNLTNGQVNFAISSDGAATTSATSAVISDGTWYFVVGKFVPSTSVSVRINDVVVANTTSIPATIFNGNAQFQIGARQSGGTASNFFAGRAARCFLCAAAVPDDFIFALYQYGRHLYGV